MYQIAGAAQMKELDRQAIEEYGVSSLGLMERAAQAVAEEVYLPMVVSIMIPPRH